MFQPDRLAGEQQMEAFLPHAGRAYASGRNFDFGPEAPSAVSKLSPWIRLRLLPEWEVVQNVLQQHSAKEAGKFIDEVCWRTYWKGWLALRPQIWDEYITKREELLGSYSDHSSYTQAIAGKSGIACFDFWVRELVDTGYLHNHARMWFASIWVHTLRLPWELGADFFLRHLLDGDAASNTLSWRWVAGLHTKGKAYLATSQNIAKYTEGRFEETPGLAKEPAAVNFVEHPKPRSLNRLPNTEAEGKAGLLLTEDDLSAEEWIRSRYSIATCAAMLPMKTYEALAVSDKVVAFRKSAVESTGKYPAFYKVDEVLDWCRSEQLDTLIMAEPAIGIWNESSAELKAGLAEQNIRLLALRHWWDECLYPQATHGFFRFKKAIPSALDPLHQPELFHA